MVSSTGIPVLVSVCEGRWILQIDQNTEAYDLHYFDSPVWLLFASGVIFMSATDEELRWADGKGECVCFFCPLMPHVIDVHISFRCRSCYLGSH
jgi:hypothetical protein